MCFEPVSLTREISGRKYTQYVPCNKCDDCLKDKQNEYVLRTIEESKKGGEVWFFTLTYSNDTVPQFDVDGELVDEATGEVFEVNDTYNVLNDKDVTNWKKRVRRRINYKREKEGLPNIKFSFMICGEYGPQTHRPHYHGLFIGLPQEYVMQFKQDWEKNFGYTSFSYIPRIPVNGRSQVESTARYVSKYICKLNSLEDPNVVNGILTKPHKMVSPGYGLPKDFDTMVRYHLALDKYDYDPNDLSGLTQYELKDIVNTIKRRRKFTNNGNNYKLPNYYKRKIFYYKDNFSMERASQISKMVSKSLQMDIQKDFARQCSELADREHLPETNEALCYAAKCVSKAEKDCRYQLQQSLLKKNIEYIRKSKF